MRKTKIVGFSVPPELHKKLDDLTRKGYKTKSELFREILDVYLKTIDHTARGGGGLEETDLAKALKAYWDLRSHGTTETIIVGLGIIEKDGQVLLGRRAEKDKWVENL